MPVRVSQLARVAREDSVGALAREAMLRVSKRLNLSRFQTEIEREPELEYRFVGYYQPALSSLSAHDRQAIVRFADRVLAGEFPLMGYGNVSAGSPPDWSRDWVSGKDWPLSPADSLVIARHDGSDVKAPWELSRLQFLPVLAKANLITGDETFRGAAQELASDWIDRNPVGVGVNWTLAMEAALRGVSLCLMLELMWPLQANETAWLAKVTRSLWQHLLFVEAHNEFSHLIRSNHYLSNIVGLTTLSAALRGPGTDKLLERYARAVQQEILIQTYADGGDWEASTGYHAFVSQMFLHSYQVQKARGIPVDPAFEQRLIAMFRWMATLVDSQETLPHIGDCDDGRIELLLDDIQQSALPAEQRNSLRLANYLGVGSQVLGQQFGGSGGDASWFGAEPAPLAVPRKPRVEVLENSGLAVARSSGAELIFAAMPNGINGRGSHTHSDKLSFVLRLGDAEVFCDSGTRCYTRDAKLRNRYRSAPAHNVVTVDYQEHNTVSLDKHQLFRSGNEAMVSPIDINGQNGEIVFTASHSGYGRFGVRCSRTLSLGKKRLNIKDQIQGGGNHAIGLFFQIAPEWIVSAEKVSGTTVSCNLTGNGSVVLHCQADRELHLRLENSEISRAYGAASPATCISIHTAGELPITLNTTIEWDR